MDTRPDETDDITQPRLGPWGTLRFIWRQLIIFSILSVITAIALGWYYLQIPTAAGIGQYTLKADLPETIDLLLLDGAKGLYPDVLALVEARLRPGAFLVADDADASPEYLARVRSPQQGYLSTPFDDDVEVSMRLI